MKVYIVFDSYYDSIEKVFSDKEKAKAFKKTGESGDYYIREFETSDEDVYEVVHGFDFGKYFDIEDGKLYANNHKVEYDKDRYIKHENDNTNNSVSFWCYKDENKAKLFLMGHEFGKNVKIAECRKKYLAKFNEYYNLVIEKYNSGMSEKEIQELLDSMEF